MSRTEFLEVYRDFITKWWGLRCSEASPGCIVCAAWALHDAVAMSLYEDDEGESDGINPDDPGR